MWAYIRDFIPFLRFLYTRALRGTEPAALREFTLTADPYVIRMQVPVGVPVDELKDKDDPPKPHQKNIGVLKDCAEDPAFDRSWQSLYYRWVGQGGGHFIKADQGMLEVRLLLARIGADAQTDALEEVLPEGFEFTQHDRQWCMRAEPPTAKTHWHGAMDTRLDEHWRVRLMFSYRSVGGRYSRTTPVCMRDVQGILRSLRIDTQSAV